MEGWDVMPDIESTATCKNIEDFLFETIAHLSLIELSTLTC